MFSSLRSLFCKFGVGATCIALPWFPAIAEDGLSARDAATLAESRLVSFKAVHSHPAKDVRFTFVVDVTRIDSVFWSWGSHYRTITTTLPSHFRSSYSVSGYEIEPKRLSPHVTTKQVFPELDVFEIIVDCMIERCIVLKTDTYKYSADSLNEFKAKTDEMSAYFDSQTPEQKADTTASFYIKGSINAQRFANALTILIEDAKRKAPD